MMSATATVDSSSRRQDDDRRQSIKLANFFLLAMTVKRVAKIA
jgi:hypothetical protein